MELRTSQVRDVCAGNGVVVYQPANIYQCTLEDGVFVGPFVEIQRGCRIGAASRIQSHTFICENVTVGQRCFIGHNVTFANDLFKGGAPNPDPSSWLRIVIEDDVTIGSGATILAERIVSGVVVGAGSVVTRPLLVKGVYAGNPARLIRSLE